MVIVMVKIAIATSALRDDPPLFQKYPGCARAKLYCLLLFTEMTSSSDNDSITRHMVWKAFAY